MIADGGEFPEHVLRADLEGDETPGRVVHRDLAPDGVGAHRLYQHQFLIGSGALEVDVVANFDTRRARDRDVLRRNWAGARRFARRHRFLLRVAKTDFCDPPFRYSFSMTGYSRAYAKAGLRLFGSTVVGTAFWTLPGIKEDLDFAGHCIDNVNRGVYMGRQQHRAPQTA